MFEVIKYYIWLASDGVLLIEIDNRTEENQTVRSNSRYFQADPALHSPQNKSMVANVSI